MLDRTHFGSFARSATLHRGWIAWTLLFMLLAPLVHGQFEGQRIDKIEFQGLTSYKPDYLAARLKSKVGQTYNPADVSEDLKELQRIMDTASVHAEPSGKAGGVVVRFVVSEFPRLRKLQVIGNQKVTTARIETLARLKAGDTVDEKVQESLKRALQKEYKESGLPQARIAFNVIEVPREQDKAYDQVDVQIVVDEGKQVLVKDLVFKGNKAFTDVRLRFVMETKGSWSFIKNYYSEQTFKDDLDRLRDFYAGHGYFDARVERGLFSEHEAKGKLFVSPVIQISEGERYRFGKARISGVRLLGQAEAQEPFKPLEGELFDGQRFGRALGQLRDLYNTLGYLTTEIQPQYDYDAKNRIINANIEVNEKGRILVGDIKLARPKYEAEDSKHWFGRWYERMSPPVTDKTVLRELLLKPGDTYNKQLERDSLRRLARLGVFDNDKLKAYNEPTGTPGVHNMVIEAQEAVTGALSGGVGYGDVTGAFVFGAFNERNLFGEANVFSLQALLGQRDSSVTASYLERHLGDSDNSLLTRAYFNNRYLPGYRARIIGASSEWGHPLVSAPDWTMYLRGRLEAVRLNERSHYHAEEDLDRSYPVSTLRLRFEQDTRYPLGNNPREGHLQSYGVEAGYAGGGLLKFEGSRDQYWPLSERLTYRMDARAGLMPYDSDVVPIHERYFLGGDTDLRGFRYRGAGYHDPDDERVPTGGAAKLLVKNELHFPIIDPISGLGFVDAGMLGRSPTDWQSPRVSAGSGVKFNLKNVQVELDVAVPLLKQDEDQTRYFHFSLQSAF